MRVVMLCLLLVPLAGCLGGDEAPPQAPPGQSNDPPARRPAQGINWSMLSVDQYAILPPVQHYVPSFDGILLHVVVHLPDGPGPWPTIFQNSPYYSHPANGVATIGLVGTYVPKGYAVVSADVRGTGNSEGCMNMMGPDERRDTYELVEWIAAQDWSDGHVGMQGVSYVGTTPHEALIEAPPHLDTVVTIAGVTNQWRNVYQNGVPYANRFYPITYEATEGAPPPTDFTRQPAHLLNTLEGACDQEEALAAMAPGTYEKGVYSSYWHERNFTRYTSQAKASILYSQGFVDRAVNPMEAVGWFNELPVPKKGFFHQGGHQYPPREDYFDTELAWFDHWLKGTQNGVMDTSTVEVQLNDGRIRVDDAWPPRDATPVRYYLDNGGLQATAPPPSDLADASWYAGPGAITQVPDGSVTSWQWDSSALDDPLMMAGSAVLQFRGSIGGLFLQADNGYWLFDLYDVAPDGSTTWLAEGWFNGHLKGGFDHIEPLERLARYDFTIRFEPRDYLFGDGHRIRLVASGYDSRVQPWDEAIVSLGIDYGPSSFLTLPTVPEPAIFDAPPEVTDGVSV